MKAYYDMTALGKLYGEAFSGASEAEISVGALLRLEKIYTGSFTVSRDGMSWETVELYRSPQGDGMVLVWGFGDGGNMFANHSKGPCVISEAAGEALVNGLKALQPVTEWPEDVAWCAADAGMLKSPPGLRAERQPEIRREAKPIDAQSDPKDRRKAFIAVPILLLILALFSYGLFTAAGRDQLWTVGGMCAFLCLLCLSWLILAAVRPKTRRGRILSILAALLLTAAIVGAGASLALRRGL